VGPKESSIEGTGAGGQSSMLSSGYESTALRAWRPHMGAVFSQPARTLCAEWSLGNKCFHQGAQFPVHFANSKRRKGSSVALPTGVTLTMCSDCSIAVLTILGYVYCTYGHWCLCPSLSAWRNPQIPQRSVSKQQCTTRSHDHNTSGTPSSERRVCHWHHGFWGRGGKPTIALAFCLPFCVCFVILFFFGTSK